MRGIISIALGLVLCGCVTTSGQVSFVDPSFHGEAIGKVIVVRASPDLSERQQHEMEMCKSLEEAGLEATPLIVLLPPTEQFTLDKLVNAARERHIDYVMVITMAGESRETVPTLSLAIPTNSGMVVNTPGIENRSLKTYEARLFRISVGKVAWLGSVALSSNNNNDSPKDFHREMVKNTIEAMRKDGIIK